MYSGFAFGGQTQAPNVPLADQNAPFHQQSVAMANYLRSPERDREMFERGLQQQEQARRQYDSETARQKQGILSGLLPRRVTFG